VALLGGLGMGLTVLRRVRGGLDHPSGGWFWRRFIAAAGVIVDRWGPGWTKRRLFGGAPLGAWILLACWLGGAVLLARKLLW